MDASRTSVFPQKSSSSYSGCNCFGRQRSSEDIFKWNDTLYFLNIWKYQRLHFFTPRSCAFYSSLVHLQKYGFGGLIWCHKRLCHKQRKTVFLPLLVWGPMTQAVNWNVFFLSVALASLANSTGICINGLGIAFDVIRLLISCRNSSLPPDVFFWFTLTPRSLYSVYVCFCVLSKIPNDSLDCPLLVESFPVLTCIFLLNACIRIFLLRLAVTLQGVNYVLSVCVYRCILI